MDSRLVAFVTIAALLTVKRTLVEWKKCMRSAVHLYDELSRLERMR